MAISPNTPYSIIEVSCSSPTWLRRLTSQLQGGAFDPPGGPGIEKCYTLTNHEFARVFYKNNMAAGVTIFNIYMVWCNLLKTSLLTLLDLWRNQLGQYW